MDKTMTIEPMAKRVLGTLKTDYKALEAEGIIIPATVQNSNIITVEVTRCGEKCKENLKLGDKVLIDKTLCIELKLGEIRNILMNEEDILAVFE